MENGLWLVQMNKIIKKIFFDSNGRQKVAQTPNLPIIVWFGSSVLIFITSGSLELFFKIIAFGSIFTWAWLEIFEGESYFRRLMGSIVIIISITAAFNFLK